MNRIRAVNDGEFALDSAHQRGEYSEKPRPDIVRSHGLDADTYIRKPVEPEEFVSFVQSVEDFWLAIVRGSPERRSPA